MQIQRVRKAKKSKVNHLNLQDAIFGKSHTSDGFSNMQIAINHAGVRGEVV